MILDGLLFLLVLVFLAGSKKVGTSTKMCWLLLRTVAGISVHGWEGNVGQVDWF
jgi:hypothetical protein